MNKKESKELIKNALVNNSNIDIIDLEYFKQGIIDDLTTEFIQTINEAIKELIEEYNKTMEV